MKIRAIVTGLLFAALLPTPGGLRAGGKTGDYPCWRGPNYSGGIETGQRLVRSWKDAKLLWASEDSPLPENKGGVVRPREVCGNGGFGAAVVKGDRVYVAAYAPAGPLAEIHWHRTNKSSPDYLRRIAADEQLYCLDAETGRTLWKAVFKGMGLNKSTHEHVGHYIPCIADGRAYWVGTLGRLFCVDANTGEKLWHVSTGGDSDNAYRYLQYCLEMKKLGGRGPRDRSFRKWKAERDEPVRPEELLGSRGWGWDSIPQYADGVIAVNTPGRGAAGFDAKTGKKLWHIRNATATTRPLLVWRHEGKAYFVSVLNRIRCIEPRTGKVLWSEGGAGTPGYSGLTPAIHGDKLIALTDCTDRTKNGSFGCWELSTEGAKLLWSLPKIWRHSWGSVLVHRGRVWFERKETRRLSDRQLDFLNERYPKVFDDIVCSRLPDIRHIFACADLETGDIEGFVPFDGMACGSPVAMNGRIFLPDGYGISMIDAASDAPRHLGGIGPGHIISVSPTAAGGRLYFRGAKHLLHCWEMRTDPPTPKRPRGEIDPDRATYVIDLKGLRLVEPGLRVCWGRGRAAEPPTDSADLRWHIRTAAGEIAQSWVTYAPDHLVADWSYPGEISFTDEGVSGTARLHVLGRDYPIEVDLKAEGRTLSGTWKDTKTSEKVAGKIDGSVAPAATTTGRVKLEIRREWCGGANWCHQTYLNFDLVDGKGRNPTLTCENPEDGWTAEVSNFDVRLVDNRLRGQFDAKLDSSGIMKSGDYQVIFNVPIACNRPQGEYHSYREGENITPKSEVNRQVWGTIEPPADQEVDPAGGIYDLRLKDALPGGKALHISVTLRKGKAIAVKSYTPRYSDGDHTIDFSKVTLEGNRLRGPVEAIIRADGYNPPHDHRCRYDIDVTVDGREATGSFTGLYNIRKPRQGKAQGEIQNE